MAQGPADDMVLGELEDLARPPGELSWEAEEATPADGASPADAAWQAERARYVPPLQGRSPGDLLQLARLAEATENFDDMCLFMRQLALVKGALDEEERTLLSLAYKGCVGRLRAAWRRVWALLQDEHRDNEERRQENVERTRARQRGKPLRLGSGNGAKLSASHASLGQPQFEQDEKLEDDEQTSGAAHGSTAGPGLGMMSGLPKSQTGPSSQTGPGSELAVQHGGAEHGRTAGEGEGPDATGSAAGSAAGSAEDRHMMAGSLNSTNGLPIDELDVALGVGSDNERAPMRPLAVMSRSIRAQLEGLCLEFIDLIRSHLLARAQEDVEATVFYEKLVADYYRYLSEHTTEGARKGFVGEADLFYSEALRVAREQLASTHPLLLGLALNASVFYYEIMNTPDKACDLAKTMHDAAVAALDTPASTNAARGEGEEEEELPPPPKDSYMLIDLLRENLTEWTLSES